ncbi:hypothetical protein [Sphingobacterium kyonggiense]
MKTRFQDQKLRLSDFYSNVIIQCPRCNLKAIATVDFESRKARLLCENCTYSKDCSTEATFYGTIGNLILPAHQYFYANLWLLAPFKNDIVWAYNYEHLDYLESYITAKLREHKDREHFTLLEKLPRFYHDRKNRDSLLKLIAKLRLK